MPRTRTTRAKKPKARHPALEAQIKAAQKHTRAQDAVIRAAKTWNNRRFRAHSTEQGESDRQRITDALWRLKRAEKELSKANRALKAAGDDAWK